MTDPAGKLAQALRIAEAALADIGDADREPGDDLAWCERRAAKALPQVRAALAAHDSAQPLTASMMTPAQLAALAREKAEPVAWPTTREEMEAYWNAYLEHRADGEGVAIRAGLEAYQAERARRPPAPTEAKPVVIGEISDGQIFWTNDGPGDWPNGTLILAATQPPSAQDAEPVCDCQDEPNGFVSNECPVHNLYPQAPPDINPPAPAEVQPVGHVSKEWDPPITVPFTAYSGARLKPGDELYTHPTAPSAELAVRCVDCHEPAPIAVCETCARLRAESVRAATAPVQAKDADDVARLRELLRRAQPLADPESQQGLQWMLEVRAELNK